MNNTLNGNNAGVLSAVIGCSVFLIIKYITGENDPQAHPSYYAFGIPSMIISSFIIGLFSKRFYFRVGFIMVFSQVVLGFLIVESNLGLLPIGLAVNFIFSIPCLLFTYFGAYLSQQK